jgi:hypothetical protein
MMWMENGKSKILPKTMGTSIMVSGFICACHGFMQLGELIEAGIARDGWFTNKHLVAQFERSKDMFKVLHPGCEVIIAFDNSMTHHAKAPDALDLSKIKLSDGIAGGVKVQAAYEAEGVVMRDGWYIDNNGTRVVHEMQHPSIDGAKRVQKGALSLLKERGDKHLSSTGKALRNVYHIHNFYYNNISIRISALLESYTYSRCHLYSTTFTTIKGTFVVADKYSLFSPLL